MRASRARDVCRSKAAHVYLLRKRHPDSPCFSHRNNQTSCATVSDCPLHATNDESPSRFVRDDHLTVRIRLHFPDTTLRIHTDAHCLQATRAAASQGSHGSSRFANRSQLHAAMAARVVRNRYGGGPKTTTGRQAPTRRSISMRCKRLPGTGSQHRITSHGEDPRRSRSGTPAAGRGGGRRSGRGAA